MDDVTDVVFRRIVGEMAPPDMYFTEFVSVDGLQSPGRGRIIHKLALEKTERPVVAQIWGQKPENFEKTASELVDMGFDGVDLNFGCPVDVVVKNGCGSGMINKPDLAVEIVQAVKRGVAGRVPVSVKTRLGYNQNDFTWHELLLSQGIDMLTVHGRTRKEMSKVPARWEDIAKVVEIRNKIAPNTLIVGNGDVRDHTHGLQLAAESGVDGVMIGRGIFHNPYAFSPEAETFWLSKSSEEKKQLYKNHINLFCEIWQDDAQRRLVTLNKFCKLYINGFDGAKEMRESLMACKTSEELLALL
jgi:nifR3 family TIM-barrel protein